MCEAHIYTLNCRVPLIFHVWDAIILLPNSFTLVANPDDEVIVSPNGYDQNLCFLCIHNEESIQTKCIYLKAV